MRSRGIRSDGGDEREGGDEHFVVRLDVQEQRRHLERMRARRREEHLRNTKCALEVSDLTVETNVKAGMSTSSFGWMFRSSAAISSACVHDVVRSTFGTPNALSRYPI